MPLWFTFICLRRLRRFLEAWQAGIAAAGSKAELIFWPQQFNREECEPLMEESPAGVALALALPRVPAF